MYASCSMGLASASMQRWRHQDQGVVGTSTLLGTPSLPAHDLTGWPGVDIQSSGSLLYLPRYPAPPSGEGAGYKIIFDNLEALADGGDPDGGAALAGWVAEHRGSHEEFKPSQPWDGKPRSAADRLSGLHAQADAQTS